MAKIKKDQDGNDIPHVRKARVTDIDVEVGKKLAEFRNKFNITQTELGVAIGVTFQQVQKYEKGTNRIGASRLQAIANILQVPVSFFFEGAPHVAGQTAGLGNAPSPQYVTDFLATSDGLSLTKSFMKIQSSQLRRRIVDLVEQIADEEDVPETKKGAEVVRPERFQKPASQAPRAKVRAG